MEPCLQAGNSPILHPVSTVSQNHQTLMWRTGLSVLTPTTSAVLSVENSCPQLLNNGALHMFSYRFATRLRLYRLIHSTIDCPCSVSI